MNKIALPVRENEIVEHFGQWDYFKVLTLDANGELLKTEMVRPHTGNGCDSDFSGLLSQCGVNSLVTGMIGQKAANKLQEQAISVYRGFKGDEQKLIQMIKAGILEDIPVECGNTEHLCHSHE